MNIASNATPAGDSGLPWADEAVGGADRACASRGRASMTLFWALDMPPYLCEQCADQEGT